MKHQVISFEIGSNTLRQLPENYLLAHFDNDQRCWICVPDLAANEDFAVKVFKALLKWENKYQRDGLRLLAELTPS